MALTVAAASACSGGGGGGGGEGFRVEIDGPVGPAHTNATLTFQIDVHGARPDRVELRKDGGLLAEISYPYLWAWDTTTTPEGAYSVTAVAADGDESVESDPVQVIVDRTPPAIVTRVPDAGATGVDAFSIVSVELDEAVDDRTLDEARIVFVSGNPVFGAQLSEDRRSLRLPAATDFLGFPNVGTVDLSNVRDLAGNPIADGTWDYHLPSWVPAGTPAASSSAPALALDQDGAPLVAFVAGGELRVSHREGATWTALGGVIAAGVVSTPALLVDGANAPIAAWLEDDGSRDALRAARWNGTAWDPLGAAALNATAGDATDPVLALDAAGTPLLAWNEGGRVRVSGWSAGSWSAVGAATLPATASARGEYLKTENGETLLGYRDEDGAVRMLRLSGGAWTPLGAAAGTSARGEIAISWDGWSYVPVVAFFEETAPGAWSVAVRQYDGASSWYDLAFGSLTTGEAAANPRLSNAPISQGAFFPGDPVAEQGGIEELTPPEAASPSLQLAWEEDGAIHTMVYDSFAWMPKGDARISPEAATSRPSIADDGVRGVWLAWEEAGAVQVARINHR